jgi:hypothetical protein
MPTATAITAAKFILDREARRDVRDADGDGSTQDLVVYRLPRGDGGGTYEIAGINDRYHPDLAAQLKELLDANTQPEAEADALAEKKVVEYIASYTDEAATWTSKPAIEVFLRDCVFNRGPRGAKRILQLAVGVADDGAIGRETRGAVAREERHVKRFIDKLRLARESYERKVAPPIGERAKFWKGMVARWDAAANFCKTLA